jgi:hypothetical protein
MELFGTNFAITLGSWRLCFRLALEDIDTQAPAPRPTPHRVRVVADEDFTRGASRN